MRARVVKTCTELADRGYLAGTGGNVALRVDGDHFVVTPSATDYYAMSEADVGVVRLSDRQTIEGERPVSVEAGLHAAVLIARPDCSASVHTHQPIASAYALFGTRLEVRDPRRRSLLGPRIPAVGYAPSGTSWLASRVARALKPDVHACLMRNHGAICVGEGPEQALRRVAALESECAAFFSESIADRSASLEPSVHALLVETLGQALEGDR